MKKIVKTKKIWISALAALLIAVCSVPQTMAYFTTYVKAKGGYPITLGNTTTVEENVENMTKHITIKNTGETDCFVRVKVFSGSQFQLEFSQSKGNNWEQNAEDGYWYYKDILKPGEKTATELLAKITIPEDFKDNFNIVVVQECTEVLYDESGKPYADWNRIADSSTDVGTANKEGGQ